MDVGPERVIQWLRAAGEPSRLRLLALCTDGSLSVSDLAGALRQSEPRVSRHLRILCEAGLIERLPHGQWVHYGLSPSPEALSFVRGLLAQLNLRDPVLAGDRLAARAALVPQAPSESRLGRALARLVASVERARGATLVVGVAHPEVLEGVARAAASCTVVVQSRRAAQAARALLREQGLSCRVLETSGRAQDWDLARLGGPFAEVLLDHPSSTTATLMHSLALARRVLNAGGRLWLFERYESLEGVRERVVEHPLARLRRLLAENGFHCERLSPLEEQGEHVLAALARTADEGRTPLPAGANAR
ncbi:MAG TPA: metalloregulator ArsR/SmtB family transcription factor [Steroidobacteraceae bacterium]|jgi:ArsR family transcriptional regulator|nr:metalloregulator ArsR/SmtB family transcription factor [Steroidobacteraceae bacterium]